MRPRTKLRRLPEPRQRHNAADYNGCHCHPHKHVWWYGNKRGLVGVATCYCGEQRLSGNTIQMGRAIDKLNKLLAKTGIPSPRNREELDEIYDVFGLPETPRRINELPKVVDEIAILARTMA